MALRIPAPIVRFHENSQAENVPSTLGSSKGSSSTLRMQFVGFEDPRYLLCAKRELGRLNLSRNYVRIRAREQVGAELVECTVYVNKESFKKRFSDNPWAFKHLCNVLSDSEQGIAVREATITELAGKLSLPDPKNPEGLTDRVFADLERRKLAKLNATLKTCTGKDGKEGITSDEFNHLYTTYKHTAPTGVPTKLNRRTTRRGLARPVLIGPNGEGYALMTRSRSKGDARLGRGGFKHVKKALGLHDGEEYAVATCNIAKMAAAKNMTPEALSAALRREAEFNVSMQGSPDSVQVPLFVEADGKFYFIMKLYKEGDLDNLLDKLPFIGDGSSHLPLNERLDIVHGVVKGVAEFNKKGIVHRDLKPGNVLIDRRREKRCGVVTDYGLAMRATGDPTKSHIVGTRGYKAPELIRAQLRGRRAIEKAEQEKQEALDKADKLDPREATMALLAANEKISMAKLYAEKLIEDVSTDKLDAWVLGMILSNALLLYRLPWQSMSDKEAQKAAIDKLNETGVLLLDTPKLWLDETGDKKSFAKYLAIKRLVYYLLEVDPKIRMTSEEALVRLEEIMRM